MKRHGLSRWTLILRAFVASGCGASKPVEYPAVSGRRVHVTSISADGAVPYRLGAYELVFVPGPDVARHARRAALVTDFAGGHGHARGFMEWGRAGEASVLYIAEGWARQRDSDGEPLTVFELALSPLPVQRTRGDAPQPVAATPLAVRVVVREASGDVTLTRRR
jgi:hypothetical protein